MLTPEPGSIYVMDRAYLDFTRLYFLTQFLAYFVIRSKKNFQARRLYSHPVDKATGLICDQTVVLTGINTMKHYPEKLRRVRYFDAEKDKHLTFLTNNFFLPALTIAQLLNQLVADIDYKKCNSFNNILPNQLELFNF